MSFKPSLRKIKRQFFTISIIYFLVSAIELVGDFIGDQEIVFLTKPLLMPLLIILYFPTWKQHKDNLSILLISALFFAFIGMPGLTTNVVKVSHGQYI